MKCLCVTCARKRNTAAGVTGMLLYLRGSFFQVIEGPADLVHGLYETISADQRHHRIRLLLDQPISHRSFADWSMGLARLDAAELDGIEGLNNFFANGSSFFDLEQGEAQALLVGFRDRKSTRLNSSHERLSRMPSSA